MNQNTLLGEAQITPSLHDVVTIELVKPEPDDLPPFVQITWPLQPTLIDDPARFRDTAAAIVQMFSAAHVRLAHIRARRHL
jgi:hypothetical protein